MYAFNTTKFTILWKVTMLNDITHKNVNHFDICNKIPPNNNNLFVQNEKVHSRKEILTNTHILFTENNCRFYLQCFRIMAWDCSWRKGVCTSSCGLHIKHPPLFSRSSHFILIGNKCYTTNYVAWFSSIYL